MRSFPYSEVLSIIKGRRERMIRDTLEDNSPDLYGALYCDFNSEIYKIKMELYELKWIESYWNGIEDVVKRKEVSDKEKKEMISMFSKWYEDFVDLWDYTKFDIFAFNERKKILHDLIAVNNDWNTNLNRMKVSFQRSINLLNKKIDKLKEE